MTSSIPFRLFALKMADIVNVAVGLFEEGRIGYWRRIRIPLDPHNAPGEDGLGVNVRTQWYSSG